MADNGRIRISIEWTARPTLGSTSGVNHVEGPRRYRLEDVPLAKLLHVERCLREQGFELTDGANAE